MIIKKIVFYVLIFQSLISQALIIDGTEADNHLAHKLYSLALPYYLKEINKDSADYLVNYKIGLCYYHSRSEKQKAIPYFLKAIAHLTPEVQNSLAELNFFLGELYKNEFDYKNALNYYNNYKTEILKNIKQVNNKHLVTREHLEDKIALCKKSLEYSYIYDCFGQKKNIDALFFEENNYSSVSEDDKVVDSLKINSTNFHIEKEATIAKSIDGQMVLTYKSLNGSAALFISNFEKDKWISPERIMYSVNEEGWERGECISADGKTLYFSSNREGGWGGYDIYCCTMNSDGKWSKAINLGPAINSKYDENAPFIFPAGNKLIFTSNKEFTNVNDVYSSYKSSSGNWTNPVNIGYDTNGNNNNHKQIKKSIIDSKQYKNKLISFYDDDNNSLVLLSGAIIDKNRFPISEYEILVINYENGELLSKNIYVSNADKFYVLMPLNFICSVFYSSNGFIPFQQLFDLTQNVIGKYEEYVPVTLLETGMSRKVSYIINNSINSIHFYEFSNRIDFQEICSIVERKPGTRLRISFIDTISVKNNESEDYLTLFIEEFISHLLLIGMMDQNITVKKQILNNEKSHLEFSGKPSSSSLIKMEILQ